MFDLDEAHVVAEKVEEEEEEVMDLDDLEAESDNNIFASDKYVIKNDTDTSGL